MENRLGTARQDVLYHVFAVFSVYVLPDIFIIPGRGDVWNAHLHRRIHVPSVFHVR